ncbi:TIR domain-containing adapter molecule 1 [Entelurus aequoreus]|uniref:TIR domain-containing adapter molecule 1 n=1 Tax=Entelurus aequoreus TaxID=161455 RepID=UPI002B1E0B43|nr:TIR domain-containing adapter molecule 1 [Entelurus aequoreus]XP_061879523.1 TIR domain-containing adapter molecule 1 [Entelurus aequoreus]XP_061879524.1 TIR domain-containing adapter molecule 1 [Entelurus aequoreus]
MNQEEVSDGTGLRDVYDILVSVSPEQVLSLTFQLGDSPEEDIVHALCLIVLRKEEALDKLCLLENHNLAKHVADLWKKSQDRLEDFAELCGESSNLTRESLAALARVFKILSEHRLCDPLLRNLAYKRALSSEGEDLLHDQLREEAKDVCGPELAVWLCSSRDLGSGSYHDAPNSLDEEVTNQAQDFASSVQTSCSELSFPTHLEISLPRTVPYEEAKMTPGNPEQSLTTPTVSNNNSTEQSHLSSVWSQPRSSEPPVHEDSKMDVASEREHRKDEDFNKKEPPNQRTTPTTSATSNIQPKSAQEEDEEAIFYSFVILHAPEDAEVAELLKLNLETMIGQKGATFSEDFAIPGKSTLKCVEDAINNSAFTLLLLTQNFNTRMLEVKTHTALTHSINNVHKYNTVIPLIPKENQMPRHRWSAVLQNLVPLEESKCSEKKMKKIFSSAKINKQKIIWSGEQRTQRQEAAHMFGKLNIHDNSVGFPSVYSNTHIDHSRCIIIGNNNQMTVDCCGCEANDISTVKEARK